MIISLVGQLDYKAQLRVERRSYQISGLCHSDLRQQVTQEPPSPATCFRGNVHSQSRLQSKENVYLGTVQYQ